MTLPRQRILDLPSRVDELLILLIRVASLQARAAGISQDEINNIIGPLPGAAGPEGPPGPPGEVGPKTASPMVPPLPATLLDLRLQPFYALTQILGYEHHAFTSLSYTTSAKKTLIKDLDQRLGEETKTLPEQIIVSPTTQCQIEFDTLEEEKGIASTTPTLQANAGLTSPLHTVAIHHKAVSTAGTLNIWAYWR